ncbi:1-deoxy-D-xylulose-5-phosphate synthase [Antricoccus suffuscus]|uniref:1-deoxy-D-xylulose-5-phosphate synthase n=1 Tax=Antricoccus suffuscus TaxID=1629062 RepID=A0A2T0ZXK0_9ACTN|nr:1-deoxy-D-xylulose-5-phosphate synthase [Antricoccus suffuscus]PRZ41082.1 1-deoxy-D-xylulose-5-phosphate synthase [Antricoccus suffuscus]
MGVLETIAGPQDLRCLDDEQLTTLAHEIREFVIDAVAKTGGHLGSNLGVVELTMALHRSFDSPATPIIFDTGHQAYIHKLLTGRAGLFGSLRAAGGLSGYPNRAESVHDFVENSHASTALSYADGLAKAFALDDPSQLVVAVVGDGALTGGLAWEALNNLGAAGRRVIVVLNDNGRSYAPTIGGLPRHLERICDRDKYVEVIARLAGDDVETVRRGRSATLFGMLGFDYLGPVDGHDIGALERAFAEAREAGGPVLVHCRTQKGRGFQPAETDVADRLHSVGKVDARTGAPLTPAKPTWTDKFGEELAILGEQRPELVAISAAMIRPTGLWSFSQRFPDRCFDVGIAEQQAVTSAAGLAMGGAHPVVALYATFANRAFDQTLLDVGLHRLPVTFALDRAGITGPDGPSHHGVWDLSLLAGVPGLRVAAPRDAVTLSEELREAVADDAGPTALRYPKSAIGPAIPALDRWRGIDLLRAAPLAEVLLVAVGSMVAPATEAADALAGAGVDCTVVDPRWVLPVNPAIVELAARHKLVVSVEEGMRAGGVGARVAQALADAAMATPVTVLGLPAEFIPHGERAQLLRRYGLDSGGLVRAVLSTYADRIAAGPLSKARLLGRTTVRRVREGANR